MDNTKISVDDNYLSSLIYSEIDRILQENNLDDFKELTQNQFTGYLMELGNFIKQGNYIYKNDYDKITGKPIKSYNYNNINIIYNIYIKLCMINDKVVNILGFISIMGVSYETYDRWMNESNLGSMDFVKRFKRDYEQTHENKLNDKGVNAVGVLAVLNHRFNWDDSKNQNNQIVVNVSGQGLPNLSESHEIKAIETTENA